MKSKKFTKQEITYLLLSLIAVFFIIIAISSPTIINFISSLNPLLQFIILYVGLYFTFFVIFRGISLKNKYAWKLSLASILAIIAYDLISPEYHVTSQGLVSGGLYGASSIDYIVGYIFSHIGVSETYLLINSFGVQMTLLQFLTYPFTFIILFVVGIFLAKNFVKTFTGS